MPEKTTFTAQPRTVTGKKVKKLRKELIVPSNISGSGVKSVAIQVPAHAFKKLYAKVGDTGLVYLSIEGDSEVRPVLVDQVDMDPVTNIVEHVVFKQVNLKEKIEAEVQIEIVGEFNIPGAVLITARDSVMVEALPTDLPEKFSVDIAELTEIGQSISISTLKYDASKVELLLSDEEKEGPIVMVQALKEEVEEVVEAAPVEGADAPAEGAAASTDEAAATEKTAE